MDALHTIETDLDTLEAQGARGYDAPACDCVRGLIQRAETFDGGVRERLLSRAEDHLTRLATRYTRERKRAAQGLETLQALGVPTEGGLSKHMERGDLAGIHRARKRAEYAAKRALLAVRQDSQASGLALDTRSRRRRSARQYEGSIAEWVTSSTLARADNVIPLDAGPYNAHRIAHQTLERMREVSPIYLRTQLERLDDLQKLLELPEPAPPAAAKRKRGGRSKPGTRGKPRNARSGRKTGSARGN